MKILMIAPTPFFSHRGTHIRIFEEARALEKLGHKITIVTYHNGDDINKYVQTDIDVRRINRWLFWYKKTEAGADWQKIILNIFLIRKVFYLIRIKNPDVLHCHLHEGVIIGWFMKLLFFWRKIPTISDFHGSLVGEMRSHGYLGVPPLGTIFRFLERFINGLGDVAVVSSAENIDTIKYSRKDNRAYHICDGVSTLFYDELKNKKIELRKKYNIPNNKIVVVYTGALIKNKGIDELLEAIKIIDNKSVFFVIGGYPANWVIDYINNNDLNDKVRVISPLNYFFLPEINTLSDIAIDPKSDLGDTRQASGKILQYMAASLPIICSNRPTNKNYLGDVGEYISDINPDNLVNSIKLLIKNEKYRKEKCIMSRKRVSKFGWNIIGDRLEGVYKSVIK